jgi:hypothetical protein
MTALTSASADASNVKSPETNTLADKAINYGGAGVVLGAAAETVHIGRMAMENGAFEGQGWVELATKAPYNIIVQGIQFYNNLVENVVTPLSQNIGEMMQVNNTDTPEKTLLLAGFIGAGAVLCGAASKIASKFEKKNKPGM